MFGICAAGCAVNVHPWTPYSYSGTYDALYDPDDSSTVTIDVGVSQLNDKSGNARHLVQADTTRQMALVSNDVNYRDVLDLDGGDALRKATPGAVLKNVGGATLVAICKTDTAAAARFVLGVDTNSASVFRAALAVGATASRFEIRGRRLDGDSIQQLIGGTNIDTASYEVRIGILDYTNSDAYLYGTGNLDNSTTSFQTSGSSSNTDSANIVLGSNPSETGSFYDGKIGFAAVIPAAISTADREKFEGWGAHEFLVSDKLPSTHTYKTHRPML